MIDIEHALANSFRNFHAKGLEYICLKRSPNLTVKLYLFEGDVSKVPEVVNPHDHRYDFDTVVLAGSMQNVLYRRPSRHRMGPVIRCQEFEFRTPLNGGDGFKWVRDYSLERMRVDTFQKDDLYQMAADGIHTIRMLENETVLMLSQYADVVPIDAPTSTFVPGDSREPPSLDGLYDRWTEGALRDRLRYIRDRTDIPILKETDLDGN